MRRAWERREGLALFTNLSPSLLGVGLAVPWFLRAVPTPGPGTPGLPSPHSHGLPRPCLWEMAEGFFPHSFPLYSTPVD